MHLASDYIHPTPRGGTCRIRIYLEDGLASGDLLAAAGQYAPLFEAGSQGEMDT
jgi:hypothetical protein